jgi:hypothetical protein
LSFFLTLFEDTLNRPASESYLQSTLGSGNIQNINAGRIFKKRTASNEDSRNELNCSYIYRLS